MSRGAARRAVAATLATGLAGLAVALDFEPTLRALIIIPYLLFAPGYMLALLIRPCLGFFAIPAAIAVSSSMLAALGVAMIYVGAWAPHFAMAVAMTATLAAAAAPLVHNARRTDSGDDDQGG